MAFRRIAGLAGVGYVLLSVVAFILQGTPPDYDATAAELAEYVADTSTFGWALAVSALSIVALVWFAAGFAQPFVASDREHDEAYGVVILFGLALVAATVAVAFALFAALGLRLEELDGPAVRALWDAGYALYGIGVVLTIAPALAAGVAVLQRGVLVRWFGILSLVIAVLSLAGLPAILTAGSLSQALLLGYLGTTVWALAASIVLLREA